MAGKNKTSTSVGWCPTHGKHWYTDRKRARRVANQHPEHKNVYRCDANPNLWHVGGLPAVIRHGYMTKDEYFRRDSA